MGADRYTIDVDAEGPNGGHALALALVGHGQRVLEFGCGEGHVTRVLANRGCSVVGLELDPAAAEIASRFAVEVHVVDLDRDDYISKLIGQEFDVALFGDVLEHLRDPLGALRSVQRVLAPRKGFVVLSVPNVAHADVRLNLLAGRFDYTPSGLLDETHLRFYTRESLDRLVDEAGFVTVDFRRVACRALESEIDVDPVGVDGAVLAAVLADPEAEAYQFVLRAVPKECVPADAEELVRRVRRVDDEAFGAEREHEATIRALEPRLRAADRNASDAEQRVAVAEQIAQGCEQSAQEAERRLRAAEEAAAIARADTEQRRAELNAVQRTRWYRWSAPLRHLAARPTGRTAA